MANGKVKFPVAGGPPVAEDLGGNPLTFAFGMDLLGPWKLEVAKWNAILKLIHFLQFAYNKQNLNQMNVECLGGWTRAEWLQRIQFHAEALYLGASDPLTDGGDSWVIRRSLTTDPDGNQTLEHECLDDDGNHDSTKSITLKNKVFDQDGDAAGRLQLFLDSDTPLESEDITYLDTTVFVDTDGGDVVITYPEVATVLKHYYRVVNAGTSDNQVELVPSGSELLLGENSSFFLEDQEDLGAEASAEKGWT